MPKIVDPDERRREVAEAVFRVVARDGLAQVSLRTVAAEAGLAIGSVRHYCGSYDELMALAFQTLVDAVDERFAVHRGRLGETASGSPERRRLVEDMLAEFLPLDEQRHRETAVWLAFSGAARTDGNLTPYVRRMSEGMRMVVRRILEGCVRSGRTPELDLALETDRLCALLDGLALTVITAPSAISPARTLAVLRRHLDTLAI
ncbi:TetR/AcrR family transcriptional regulator [Saccharopolyspora taberi]|uniref:TetR/AcrR family transcriptional regulator n=1 Tax=Saccharopolyspora taberi TaxID=60895 RepID=A0ABN3VMK8_9PSEU